MSVLDRPKREALVFVSLLPLCFTGVSLLLLDCDARLFECAAKREADSVQRSKSLNNAAQSRCNALLVVFNRLLNVAKR